MNNNVLYTLFFKDCTNIENFLPIEHVNYYPVVVSNINRFKLDVSNELIQFLIDTNQNIILTLHFKIKNG